MLASVTQDSKKGYARLACVDLVDQLSAGSDASGMNVDSEPTAAPAAVGKGGDHSLMSL